MRRPTQAIEADIAAQHQLIADAQRHLAQLNDELSTTRAIESAEYNQRQHIAHVLARMEFGEHLVTTPRPWWCRGGQLVERASADDMNALFALQRQGLIERSTA